MSKKALVFTKNQKLLRRRIIELSYELKLSHLGSCLTSVDVIDTIYKIKKNDENFVLSNGHAGMAYYVVLEKNGFLSENQIKTFFIHPDRNIDHDIVASTGSLGQGLPIALGMALANRKKRVYSLISDGECAEGSIWESLRIMVEQNVTNLICVVNANGLGAYRDIDLKALKKQLKGFVPEVTEFNGHDLLLLTQALKKSRTQKKPGIIFMKTTVNQLPFLNGLSAHYQPLSETDFQTAQEILK